MDRPPPAGSVRRARERAAAGLPREDGLPSRAMPGDEEPQIARPSMARQTPMGPTAGQSRLPRPQAPLGMQTRNGQIGVAISKPTQIPQWPLQGPVAAASGAGGEPYRPPPGKSQPPQRPPRPSRVPSILDSSKIQDHTPVFQYRPQSGRESVGMELLSVPETPSSLSRQSTLSSVVSIPDFPIPAQLPPGPPRRSVNLGPPPSARRGASSFYSNASYVSPIPEESPRSRSRASFASSAAMPESWGTPSPGPSPDYPDADFDDTIVEEGPSTFEEDDAEDSRLVRSASLGKRAKATLVGATAPRGVDGSQRPGLAPVQSEPFKDGTGYLENSSSSSTLQTTRGVAGSSLTADAILNAYSSASATDTSSPSSVPMPSPQPPSNGRPFSRLSAIRRPPRLDLDAVKKAESRGSLTSLPDLIRRATRLAASLEKGRRPASRIDDLDGYSGQDDYGAEKDASYDGEKHRSGFSDMLAAFPPPAQAAAGTSRRSFRESIRDQVQSWPLPFNSNRTPNTSQEAIPNSSSRGSGSKEGRRCCGLPLWGFIVVMIVVLLLIAAAVVIPVEFFIVRKQNVDRGSQQAALDQCQAQLACSNGGTNVVNQGICSCICKNGFTGFNCAVAGSIGCSSISLAGGNNLDNVTVGDAIPRLIQQAQTNFSIPLSGTEIVAKLNAGNMSCAAENALVTFDGQATRDGAALAQSQGVVNAVNVVNGVAMITITIMVGEFTTFTVSPATADRATSDQASPQVVATTQAGGGVGFTTLITAPGTFATTISLGRSTRPYTTSTVTTTMPMAPSTPNPAPTATFNVTEEVLDFARVAVLFILQKESLANAETAQNTLQKFFTSSTPGASVSSSAVSVQVASNVTVGNGNSVDLVNFFVDTGATAGKVGGRSALNARSFSRAMRYGRIPPPIRLG
ncbi:hypothetical protein B0T26DRAFT_646764 [Lasiosphaeria miniovina]|uniref:EGF-like domain-containing protein n=1 Tax=Lasiosphaeria miniovina TaxID=1954250 RepID=A0AA40DUP9_9PEZI|nr:uncharacterized protein B0T26DRAFT_646764 [Lasiosphaeria miniovina]KAK0717079.1 hypothetical protein B0T26DRAFT_646764 [Lasiosphaeria miniovina]